jgi:signal peptidase
MGMGLLAIATISILSRVKIMAVISGSMKPAIPVGSMVLTPKVNLDALRPGNVITFGRDQRNIIHQIQSTHSADNQAEFVTKGDASTSVNVNWVNLAR